MPSAKGSNVEKGDAYKIRFPQAFCDTVQLIRRRPRNCKIFRRRDTSDTNRSSAPFPKTLTVGTHVSIVEMNGFGFGFSGVASGIPATTGSIKYGPNLPSRISQPSPSENRAYSPLLIQRAADEMRKRLGRDLALFLHAVHVDSETQGFAQGVGIRREAGETDEEFVIDGEDLVRNGNVSNGRGLRWTENRKAEKGQFVRQEEIAENESQGEEQADNARIPGEKGRHEKTLVFSRPT
jgi:hypothetical protein